MIKLFKYLFYVCLIVLGFLIYSCAEEVDEQNTIENWAANNLWKIIQNGTIYKDKIGDIKIANDIIYTTVIFHHDDINGDGKRFLYSYNTNLNENWKIELKDCNNYHSNNKLLLEYTNNSIYILEGCSNAHTGSLSRYNTQGEKLILDAAVNAEITSITTDSDGNIWLLDNSKIKSYGSKNVDVNHGLGNIYNYGKILIGSDNAIYVKEQHKIYKYIISNQNLSTIWSKTPNGTNSLSYLRDFIVDSNNNIYLVGDSGSAGQRQVFLMKYNSSGDKQWEREFGGDSADYAYNLVQDITGNLFISTTSPVAIDGISPYCGNDIYLYKFDANGNKNWVRRLGSSIYSSNSYCSEIPSGMAILPSRNSLYIVGTTEGAFEGFSDSDVLNDHDTFIARTWTYKTVSE